MIDISELNYKQLIALEKEIQQEKTKKISVHLIKGNLENSTEMSEIYDLLDERFREEKYGWPQKTKVEIFDWASDEEKEQEKDTIYAAPVVNNLFSRLSQSMLFMCDIAFQNYHDTYSKRLNCVYTSSHYGPKDEERYFTVMMNKEIPWEKSEDYKNMFEELSGIFLKYAERKGESE